MTPTPLTAFAADFRAMVTAAAEAAGFADPVAFDPDDFAVPLLHNSTRGRFVPVSGAFVRDWDPHNRRVWPGVAFGARLSRSRRRSTGSPPTAAGRSGGCS